MIENTIRTNSKGFLYFDFFQIFLLICHSFVALQVNIKQEDSLRDILKFTARKTNFN